MENARFVDVRTERLRGRCIELVSIGQKKSMDTHTGFAPFAHENTQGISRT